MTYSKTSPDPRKPVISGREFASRAGVADIDEVQREPFEKFDDLMTLVEGLCVSWPARERISAMRNMRL